MAREMVVADLPVETQQLSVFVLLSDSSSIQWHGNASFGMHFSGQFTLGGVSSEEKGESCNEKEHRRMNICA